MAYGVFNRESGNLVESFNSEKRALAFVAELLDSGDIDADAIAVIASSRRGRTKDVLTGEPLREAAAAHARQAVA